MTVCLSVYYSLVTCQETALLRQKHSWAQNEKLVRVNVISLRQFLGMLISYHTKEEKRKSNISLSLNVFNIQLPLLLQVIGVFFLEIQTQVSTDKTWRNSSTLCDHDVPFITQSVGITHHSFSGHPYIAPEELYQFLGFIKCCSLPGLDV